LRTLLTETVTQFDSAEPKFHAQLAYNLLAVKPTTVLRDMVTAIKSASLGVPVLVLLVGASYTTQVQCMVDMHGDCPTTDADDALARLARGDAVVVFQVLHVDKSAYSMLLTHTRLPVVTEGPATLSECLMAGRPFIDGSAREVPPGRLFRGDAAGVDLSARYALVFGGANLAPVTRLLQRCADRRADEEFEGYRSKALQSTDKLAAMLRMLADEVGALPAVKP
jgi:hypothetical protein